MQSSVTVNWKDGSHNEMKVVFCAGKSATLEFAGGGDEHTARRRAEHVQTIKLHRAAELDIFRKPSQKYFSAFMHADQVASSPFVDALLQLQPAGGADESTWWRQPMAASSDAFRELACFQALNASQQAAIVLANQQRITIVQGPPGTGQAQATSSQARVLSAKHVLAAANVKPFYRYVFDRRQDEDNCRSHNCLPRPSEHAAVPH
jgi:hypothetical protein